MSDLTEYYNRRWAALIEELEKRTFNVVYTSNIWSGRAREDYIRVVIHYIDND